MHPLPGTDCPVRAMNGTTRGRFLPSYGSTVLFFDLTVLYLEFAKPYVALFRFRPRLHTVHWPGLILSHLIRSLRTSAIYLCLAAFLPCYVLPLLFGISVLTLSEL